MLAYLNKGYGFLSIGCGGGLSTSRASSARGGRLVLLLETTLLAGMWRGWERAALTLNSSLDVVVFVVHYDALAGRSRRAAVGEDHGDFNHSALLRSSSVVLGSS